MAADHNNDLREHGTGELLKQLSDHTTTLVRQEIELAKAELGEKGKKAGLGAGKGMAQENPLGLAIGAVAVGFVGGLLIPSTRVEDEKLGPMADQVKEKAKETGQEAMDRGREVARQAADSAKETAQEAGREQADGLRDSAQQKAGQVSS